MFVYVVEEMVFGECEGVDSVFSTKEKAEAHSKEAERGQPEGIVFPVTKIRLNRR